MSKKNDSNDLSGFEEFIEYTEGRRFIRGTGSTRKREESFELLTFLETESVRLEKALVLLEDKIPNIKNYPQDISLTVKQETTNITLKTEIIQAELPLYSGFNKNMATLFNLFFGKELK